ncbi:Rhodanese-like domain-containing protein [Hysterangium stoloniferum]|nr:Rhodanese-like domain-containing protein [Hysterangium stoloniferum]
MSSAATAPLLLTPAQASRLSSPSAVFVDASWVMPTSPRHPTDEFRAFRLPRARFLDIDHVAAHTEEGRKLGLKHMMPEPETFARACEKLGIAPHSHVILYDTHGVFSSPRALFMFRAFSHTNSSVLNGGLPRWVDEGHQVETGSESHASGPTVSYPTPTLNPAVVKSYAQMVTNSALQRSDSVADLVVDARARGRYLGADPEPRPGLPSGHIPNSFSLPFNHFVQPRASAYPAILEAHPSYPYKSYTTLRTPDEITEQLTQAVGVEYAGQILNGQRSAVATCGSGMTAAVLWLGISSVWEAQGRDFTMGIYDESWTGYAARAESKIITGEEE